MNKSVLPVDNSRGCGYPATFPQVLCELGDAVKDSSVGPKNPLHLFDGVENGGVVSFELGSDFGEG